MDTLNDVMTDLLIDQDSRLNEGGDITKPGMFILKANRAEKIVLDGVEADFSAN